MRPTVVRRSHVLAALAGLLLAPALLEAQPAAPGRLVIIGGGLSRTNEDVYRAVLDARQGSGPFCIIPTAGATPDSAMAGPVANFERYSGAGTAQGVLVSALRPETARDPDVVAQIRQCSGFFFIGGVQSRIIDAFRPGGAPTPAYEALMQRWREGAVVSGSSAGAAMMSHPMIAGGSSAGAMANGVSRSRGAVSDEDENAGGGVSITAGMGFFPEALVDQHFLARGRIGRLLVAVADMSEFDLGFGIDENTALVVDGDTVYTVGASGVVIVDGRDAQRDGSGVTGMRLHLMGVGDRFSLATRRLTLAADKTSLPGGAVAAVPDDLFARWSFLHLLHQLGGSAQQELTVPVAEGAVVLRKTPGFAARHRAGEGVENTPAALSVTGLTVDLRR